MIMKPNKNYLNYKNVIRMLGTTIETITAEYSVALFFFFFFFCLNKESTSPCKGRPDCL